MLQPDNIYTHASFQPLEDIQKFGKCLSEMLKQTETEYNARQYGLRGMDNDMTTMTTMVIWNTYMV